MPTNTATVILDKLPVHGRRPGDQTRDGRVIGVRFAHIADARTRTYPRVYVTEHPEFGRIIHFAHSA